MKNVIFIAPPAAGKGTQSTNLERKYGYVHISTGDLLRKAIKDETPIGKEVKDIIAKGQFVKDEIVTELLTEKLENTNTNFILDGYPRNIAQAKTLDEILAKLSIDNVIVIYLQLDEQTAMQRALGRMICKQCGQSYHKYIDGLKPLKENECDNCHIELNIRDDDNEEVFKKRYNSYLNETNPLIEYYKEKDMLKVVDSRASSDIIFENIEQILTGERSNG